MDVSFTCLKLTMQLILFSCKLVVHSMATCQIWDCIQLWVEKVPIITFDCKIAYIQKDRRNQNENPPQIEKERKIFGAQKRIFNSVGFLSFIS